PETPVDTVEGILDWKEIAWVLHPNNSGVAENIPYFLTSVLNDQQYFDHQCFFEKGRLVNFESILLPDIDFCYQPVQSAI
ncbi:MAG: mismatch repair protein MutT, partial [Bacilli bacterium]|nr:mismatch repair protein MutT [Bacilli bacterium]